MSYYDNKLKKDLIELLEEKDGTINKLQQEVDEGDSECCELRNDFADAALVSMNEDEQEALAEKSFYAGLKSDRDIAPLKAWLNFKVEERL